MGGVRGGAMRYISAHHAGRRLLGHKVGKRFVVTFVVGRGRLATNGYGTRGRRDSGRDQGGGAYRRKLTSHSGSYDKNNNIIIVQ